MSRVILFPLALFAGLALAAPSPAAARYDATITRTHYGIPHVVAKDWRGIGYGVGYAYAEDNLCLLAEEFVTIAGERSLHFGPTAKAVVLAFGEVENLTSDLFFRATVDLPALRRGAKAQGREAMLLIDGYVAGYNRRLRDIGPAGVPAACRDKAWVRAISTDDILRLGEKQVLLVSSLALAAGIANAAPPAAKPIANTMPSAAMAALPTMHEAGFGSNGWAFGGDVTANGRGFLIGNPHFPWNGPNRFWQMHVTIPGKLDVMGGGIAGSPMPTMGFNRDVAWTHTVSAARHFTLFQLTLDPADPTRYLVDGKPEQMTAQTITVPVADGAAPVTKTLYSTRFGRMVALPASGLNWSATTAFAIRDINAGNQRALGAWIRIVRARNVQDIRDAAEQTLGLPWVNTIAADRHGNALHTDVTAVPNVSAAKVKNCATPLSAIAASFATLLDGSRSACEWDNAPGTPAPGLMPANEQAVYTRRDFVTNSNDSYWISNPAAPYRVLSPIMGGAETQLSLRSRSNFIEVDRLLNGHEGIPGVKIDHKAAQKLTFGNHSLAADLVVDPLLVLCKDKPEMARGCAALAGWDRRFDLDSKGAYLFTIFWRSARLVPNLWAVTFDPKDPVNTPRDIVLSGATGEKLVAAMVAAIAQLDKEGIALDARWGDVQFTQRGAERIAVHGGDGLAGVLNLQDFKPVPGGVTPFVGSSYIQIVGFDDDGPVADAVLSYSQSTDPASPWFADQTRLYSAKRWNRLPFTKAAIAKDSLGPALRIKE